MSLQSMISISPGIQSNLKECTFVAAKKLWMPAWPTKKSITNQIGKRYLAYPFDFSNAVVFAKRVFLQLPENSVTQTDVFTLEFSLPSCAVGLAYLWETTPVLTMRGLPIYQMGLQKLPGAPWVRAVAWTLPKNVYTMCNKSYITKYAWNI